KPSMIDRERSNRNGTAQAPVPMPNSTSAYSRRKPRPVRTRARKDGLPASHDPSASPAMNTDRTIETTVVVAPKVAIARRVQITSYRSPQKPDARKKRKNIRQILLGGCEPLELLAPIEDRVYLAGRLRLTDALQHQETLPVGTERGGADRKVWGNERLL